jgi:polyhydroxybutyrate depolymerase
VPTAITTKAVPLVIALHGNGDTAANFVATRGLQQLAEAGGFVVAAPQGITQNITVGGQQVNGVDWDAYRDVAGGNIDLALLDEIQARLVKPGGQIDAKHVTVFGYSQGGYLGFRYGIDASEKLACAAVVAAASPLGSGYVTNAARKIPFALQIGTNDYGIGQARAAKAALEAAGHPLQYKEISGAGHSPFPGSTAVPLDFCLGESLP